MKSLAAAIAIVVLGAGCANKGNAPAEAQLMNGPLISLPGHYAGSASLKSVTTDRFMISWDQQRKMKREATYQIGTPPESCRLLKEIDGFSVTQDGPKDYPYVVRGKVQITLVPSAANGAGCADYVKKNDGQEAEWDFDFQKDGTIVTVDGSYAKQVEGDCPNFTGTYADAQDVASGVAWVFQQIGCNDLKILTTVNPGPSPSPSAAPVLAVTPPPNQVYTLNGSLSQISDTDASTLYGSAEISLVDQTHPKSILHVKTIEVSKAGNLQRQVDFDYTLDDVGNLNVRRILTDFDGSQPPPTKDLKYLQAN